MPSVVSAPPIKPVVKPRLGRNFLLVALTAVTILLAIGLLIAYGVAKTGILEVPAFSGFYRGAPPTRAIKAAPMDFAAFTRLLEKRIEPQMLAGATSYRLKLDEEELTAAVRGGIAGALRSQTATAKDAQMVIEPDFLELTGTIVDKPMAWHFRVRMAPRLTKQGVQFDFKDLRLGDIPVHPSIAASLAGALFSRDLGSWNIQLGSLSVKNLELSRGTLTLDLSP